MFLYSYSRPILNTHNIQIDSPRLSEWSVCSGPRYFHSCPAPPEKARVRIRHGSMHLDGGGRWYPSKHATLSKIPIVSFDWTLLENTRSDFQLTSKSRILSWSPVSVCWFVIHSNRIGFSTKAKTKFLPSQLFLDGCWFQTVKISNILCLITYFQIFAVKSSYMNYVFCSNN